MELEVTLLTPECAREKRARPDHQMSLIYGSPATLEEAA
jgi:hypothetical protein